ncbi:MULTISPECIES: GNAT family N-acetyltransferase [unclassified Gordonia (in: high G+C Gram-positive bacteria)]|uniref:GNAT family N-acetyltransferase n=1 Tax=unclassified Gordonia (in: high G+C Gram-positive bacteria) TaxID=2657482 RepID=UPI001F0E6D0B|nr:GNAT family N-acetyltransferase [Gordonia sp. ABSL49_1]MCH5643886.1 N-acetyltransferase [Gordonia sp. ABSL49_1]
MADLGTLRIVHSPAQERYEAVLTADPSDPMAGDAVVGYVDYVSEPYQVVLTHTVIREQYSGHGYAAELVQTVLEDIRASGKQVVPVCSYVQRFIERHPEYADMAVSVPQ